MVIYWGGIIACRFLPLSFFSLFLSPFAVAEGTIASDAIRAEMIDVLAVSYAVVMIGVKRMVGVNNGPAKSSPPPQSCAWDTDRTKCGCRIDSNMPRLQGRFPNPFLHITKPQRVTFQQEHVKVAFPPAPVMLPSL